MAEASGSQNVEHKVDEPVKSCDIKEKNELGDSGKVEKTNEQIDFNKPGTSKQGNLSSDSNAEASTSKADESCQTKESDKEDEEEENEKEPGMPQEEIDAILKILFGEYDLSHFDELPIKEDIYVRKAKDQEWRARSCFKLLQIDERFKIFDGVTKAVDIFASPGAWTQVLSRRLYMGETVYINEKPCLFYKELVLHRRFERQQEPKYNINENVVIVAVDIVKIPSYPGVVQVYGDLAEYCTSELILRQFEDNKADLVVCSKLLHPTELLCFDVNLQENLIANLIFTTCNILREGGTLVLTAFKETHNELLKMQLSYLFKEVDFFTPKSGKSSKTEHYAICRGFAVPEGFHPKLMEPFLNYINKDFSSLTGINRMLIPFLLCGDDSGYPLSDEDQKLYQHRQDFSVPFSMQEPVNYTKRFKSKDLDHSRSHGSDKMNEAIKNIRLDSDADVGSSCHEPSTSMSDTFDNGPLYELIQKTTKIKPYPYQSDNVVKEGGSNVSREEDQSGDSSTQKIKKNPTCTCDDDP